MDLLTCTVQPYAWGSRTAIASLLGRPAASEQPEAELWMGAHPVAPSMVDRGAGPESLEAIIQKAPLVELGAAVVDQLGPRLPFLLKVLAAAEPLSLQAHPTSAQAKAGFEDEEQRGIPLSAPHRNYKDPSHKPELLCALTPFDALSGFRAIDRTIALFDMLAISELDSTLALLRADPNPKGLEAVFRTLMTMGDAERERVVNATVTRCASATEPAFVAERALSLRLAKLYPGDIGIVSALLLELVHLDPGEAIYLGAGNMHAYLEGTGVEIMASSDNVLRGGLTKKHVDVPELLKTLDFGAGPAKVLLSHPIDAHESVYSTPAPEFRLSRVVVAGAPFDRHTQGRPEILLVVDGDVRAIANGKESALTRGQSLFIPASTDHYSLLGNGTLYRATTNLPTPP